MKMDLDKTPPAAEIEQVANELVAAKELAMSSATNKDAMSTKRKRRWDISEPTDENMDPNQGTREWSKEATTSNSNFRF
jgi:splicing factor 3B subunit 1